MDGDVTTFKAYAAVVIWFLAVFGSILPMYINNKLNRWNSRLNMLAAGIFLSGSCVHLLNDAVQNKQLYLLGCSLHHKNKTENEADCFPIAYATYVVGFLLVFLLEVFGHYLERQFDFVDISETIPLIINTQLRKTSGDKSYYSVEEDGRDHKHNPSRRCKNSLDDELIGCEDAVVTHAHVHGLLSEHTGLLSFVIFISLSFHSIMEGLGIGAANQKSYDTFLAIIAHKSAAAFSLSAELNHHQLPFQCILVIIGLFSLMTPLGILVGSLITLSQNHEMAESSISGICTALAGGTFLYVAVMEIIPQEMHKQRDVLLKSSFMILGFVSFTLLAIWI